MWRAYVTRTGAATVLGDIPEAHRLSALQSKQSSPSSPEFPRQQLQPRRLCSWASDVEKRTNWIFPAVQIEDEILPCRSLPFSVSQNEDLEPIRESHPWRGMVFSQCRHFSIFQFMDIGPEALQTRYIGRDYVNLETLGGRGRYPVFLAIWARWASAWRRLSRASAALENQGLRRSSPFRPRLSTTPMTIPPSPPGISFWRVHHAALAPASRC